MINFDYVRPATQKAAIEAFNKDASSKFIAGGTNLVDLMKRGVEVPEKLIDITRLPLQEIAKINGGLRIGTLVANSKLSEDENIVKKFPLLSQALKAGASPQLRNMATTGGNMMQRTRCPYFYDTALPCNKREPGTGCSAIEGYSRMHAIFGASAQCIAVHPSDMCVGLAALDADVIITNSKGERKIPFTEFHRLPGDMPEKDNNLEKGEMITAVELPFKTIFDKHTAYVKVRDRNSYAFALVSVAAALQIDGEKIKQARLAMGGVAHKPWRLYEAEAFLAGKNATQENFTQASKLAMKDAHVYPGNKFKIQMGQNTIIEALQKAGKA